MAVLFNANDTLIERILDTFIENKDHSNLQINKKNQSLVSKVFSLGNIVHSLHQRCTDEGEFSPSL